VRAVVQGVVADGQPASGHVGEQAGPGALAQPVQRAARLAGGGDRVEHAGQLLGDGPGAGRQQLAGAAAQAAPGAAAFFVKLVFGPAVRARVRDREPGAVRAGISGRAGRGDQPPLLGAGCAPAPVAQRGGVARVADRPFGPAGGRRAVLAAPGACGRCPRRARNADRPGGRGEVAPLTGPVPLPAGLATATSQPAVTADLGTGARSANIN
jgi:hypothetical protein